jgi:hypothetical protein
MLKTKLTAIALSLALLLGCAFGQGHQGPNSNSNANGPTPNSNASGPAAKEHATARCNDGTYSYSKHRQGTCSHHGGVAEWL